ncbi:hypothetical protein ROS62_15170 [Streptomyces sp. DSM 41972]|uniref:Uncharacterized protein n=1 Tax=Streptomyces althioticus subsp. attaecolombicae TaxID=3075534 RepID=A0ABU3HZP2_9ACTN|nr:hypothetical protein [Streptomyces sp. DSM 41972]SCD71552.1 hypothetical protein GA0115238_12175 [Streptomyces sp. di50b]SCD80274.1 hypothetical protein GA0115245_11375 [Streptomyces sp. di188]
MSDVITHERQPVEADQVTAGHGRHRGPVSTQESQASPRGRHRRPAQENEHAEPAA